VNRHPVFDPGILDGVQLLEADAGTGKTWTIAGLVVRALVERGLELDRVLVVTFTNAAAAELAERIRLRIAQLERLLDDRLEGRAGEGAGVDEPFCTAYAATLDDAAARRARDVLRVALARVDKLSVHTIHAWCQRVIDEHALSIGVARALPIGAGDGERIAARVADWWRREVLDAPVERLALFALAGVGPDALEADVRAIVGRPLARVASAPCDWRSLAARAFAARAALADAVRAEADALLAWIGASGNAKGSLKRYGARWFAELQAFCDSRLARLPHETIERFGSRRFAPAMPDSAIPGCCDALLAVAAELPGLRAAAALEIVESLRSTRVADRAQASSLAFDDLLRLVHEALVDPTTGPSLARALRERNPVALVDECQDTDPLQWDILRRIYACGERCDADRPALVLVGDPKQAIYSFRGADVHAYLAARAGATRRHRLDENQRSHPALIDAVNALFQVDGAFRVDGIAFEPASVGARERRVFDASAPPGAGPRAPMTVVALEDDVPGERLSAPRARRQAIDATVAEIARLLAASPPYGERTLQPGDIAVLVQARTQGASVKRALARAGIGAAEISRDSVLDTLEGDELIRVVAALDDSADPARLRSALATTLLGFDAASLARLATDSSHLLELTERFVDARLRWERHGPIAALRPLLHAFDVGVRLAGLVDGERRMTNLGHLVSLLAEDAEARESPRAALRAWTRMRTQSAQGEDDTRELRLESDENLVRILTVHKSKGLEFPVVFVPFAWSGQRAKAPEPCVRHERDDDGAWRTVLDLAPDDAARRAAAAERQAEDLRTLYVALTRAEQRCYLFWGSTSTAMHSPLAWLLHGADDGSGDAPPALDAQGVRAALARWQARAERRRPGSVAVVDAPTLLAGPRRAPARTPETGPVPSPSLAARASAVAVPPASVTTSFSAIAAALVGGDAPPQTWQNVDVVDPAPEAPHGDGPEEDALAAGRDAGTIGSIRFRFPAGAQAGVCLHGILEQAAFDASLDVPLVAQWLARCGYRRSDASAVSRWLDEALRVPLRAPDGARIVLSEVPRTRQLREMEFHLPGRDVSEHALVDAIGDELAIDPRASLRRWSGFLRGFVDLVFEHEGRWYIVDWKSNHLGDDVARYGHAALAEAMRAHAYPLQAALYTLALHRWLRRSLPGYDYERSFGGVFYVFLRAAGLDVPANPHAFVPGVHASRPSVRTVERLDRLFDRGSAGGAR